MNIIEYSICHKPSLHCHPEELSDLELASNKHHQNISKQLVHIANQFPGSSTWFLLENLINLIRLCASTTGVIEVPATQLQALWPTQS